MAIEKECLYCGKKFIADREARKFCSRSCSSGIRGSYVFDEEAGLYDENTNGFQCQYNPGVICYSMECEQCGWNPEVAKARLEAFKRKGME